MTHDMAVPPHTISEELHLFDCKLKELYHLKVERDDCGDIDYLGLIPEKGTIICAFECLDGAMIVMWEGEE